MLLPPQNAPPAPAQWLGRAAPPLGRPQMAPHGLAPPAGGFGGGNPDLDLAITRLVPAGPGQAAPPATYAAVLRSVVAGGVGGDPPDERIRAVAVLLG